MQITGKYIRSLCLCMIVGASLLLPAFSGQPVARSASGNVETMTTAELDRLMTGSREMQVWFFTAAWCGHCKAMLPILNRLFRRFQNSGLRFIAISIDSSMNEMHRALEKQPVDFQTVWVGEKAVDHFRLMGIPMIFLIKEGHLVEKIPGKWSDAFLEAKIQDFTK